MTTTTRSPSCEPRCLVSVNVSCIGCPRDLRLPIGKSHTSIAWTRQVMCGKGFLRKIASAVFRSILYGQLTLFLFFRLQSRRLAFDETTSMRVAASGTPRRCFVAYFYVHTRRCWTKEPAEVVCPVPDRHCEPIGQRKEKDWLLCRSCRRLDSIFCSSCEGRKGRSGSLDWIGIPWSRRGGRFPNGLGKVRVGH